MPIDRLTKNQIAMVRKIIANETWYEGERRKCYVPEDDPVVIGNVAAVVLKIGQDMRKEAEKERSDWI